MYSKSSKNKIQDTTLTSYKTNNAEKTFESVQIYNRNASNFSGPGHMETLGNNSPRGRQRRVPSISTVAEEHKFDGSSKVSTLQRNRAEGGSILFEA